MRYLVTSVMLLGGSSAIADVTDATEYGFTTVNEVVIDSPRMAAWGAAVGDVGSWWSDDHTVSGNARAMAITAVPQGCFCEILENGGGIVHLTVTFANPGIMLRLTGGLGPLGLMGVAGNMTWEFFDAEDGTLVRFTYVVGGYRPGGLSGVAVPVDAVIGEALQRLKAHVETGDAGNAAIG